MGLICIWPTRPSSFVTLRRDDDMSRAVDNSATKCGHKLRTDDGWIHFSAAAAAANVSLRPWWLGLEAIVVVSLEWAQQQEHGVTLASIFSKLPSATFWKPLRREVSLIDLMKICVAQIFMDLLTFIALRSIGGHLIRPASTKHSIIAN